MAIGGKGNEKDKGQDEFWSKKIMTDYGGK